LSAQIRTIARVASAGRLSNDTIARDLKLPPWRVDKAKRQSRGWTPEALVEAHAAVARADAEVKGGGTDAAYALERAVLAVARGTGR
jgi:DNA polymerase-3 subunit delta